MLAILRQRNFALLWVGQLISVFGDWVLLIALPFYIFDLTGSALATGAMFMAQTVPRVLLGSVAGVFVDRWDRKRTMIAADLSRAVLMLALLSVHSAAWLWLIYLVAFMQAMIAQFFTPAKNALLPLLVSESDLVAANALNSLSESLTRLTAPALGGALFGLLGLASVVWIDSASFLTSGVLIALIVFPARAVAVEAAARGRAWTAVVREWRDGMRLMRNDPTITAIFATAGTAMIAEGFFVGPARPVRQRGAARRAARLRLVGERAGNRRVDRQRLPRAGEQGGPARPPHPALRRALRAPRYRPRQSTRSGRAAATPGRARPRSAWRARRIVGFFIGMQTVLQASVPDQLPGARLRRLRDDGGVHDARRPGHRQPARRAASASCPSSRSPGPSTSSPRSSPSSCLAARTAAHAYGRAAVH